MAKRPSVQEILEAARRGTPIPASADAPQAPAPSPTPEPTPAAPAPASAPVPEGEEPPPRLSLREKLEKADSERAARVAAREAAAAPSEPTEEGKLSIREKLDRARAEHPIRETSPPAESDPEPDETPEPSSPAPAPAAASGAKKPLSMAEKLAAARSGGSAPAPAPSATPAPAAASGAKKPLSMAEKLAAARGNAPAASSEAKAKAEPAAAPAAAPAPAAPVAADRELPPIAEITDPKDLAEALRRAGARKDRETAGRPSGTAPAGFRAPYSPTPRPDAVAIEPPPGSQLNLDRRGLLIFVSWSLIAWSALAGAIAMLTWMMVRFLFPNAEAEPPSTVTVGRPSDYEPGEVSERFKDRWGFWVVRDMDDQGRDVIYALQTYCTHLGCPPTWLAGERKFKCPCHGSGFYKDGVNFEGPAPRPLERYKIGLADDGQIVVDKAQTYRKDLDQWSDPDSFLAV